MLVKQGKITFGATKISLGSIFSDGDQDKPVRALILQPKGTNANVIYIGDINVSATDYMFRLEAPAAGVPPAPFILGEGNLGLVRLRDLYVLGTATEILMVGIFS